MSTSIQKVFVCSSNRNKINEIESILGVHFKVDSFLDLNVIPEVIEDGSTFEANAKKKIDAILGLDLDYPIIIADDSGLCVKALNNLPGVRSARFAGECATDEQNINLLQKSLATYADKSAYFICVIGLLEDDEIQYFTAICEGKIINKKMGFNGFGYDPVFIPNNYDITYAQMDDFTKNKISHRGKALALLSNYLNQYKI